MRTPSTSGTPGFLLFAPHAHGFEVRSLPLIITVLLRSRFAHALRSLVSQRKRRAAAHNRVVLGSENPHFEDSRDQSLGDALRTGVLGKPAIALCAVPLLIPVSALICAQERPRCLRNTILSASTSACSAELSLELCITIRLYLDRNGRLVFGIFASIAELRYPLLRAG